MKKFKILHIGWANSIHVERWLRWLASRGHENYLITDIFKSIEQIKVYDINRKPINASRWERYKEFYFNFYCPPARKLNRIIRLRKFIQQIQPDIVHSHTLWYPGYLGAYLNFHPYVITVFNGDVLWKKKDLNFWERRRTKSALKKADLTTGVSGELTNAIVSHGVDRKKTHIIRRGVDLNTFNMPKDKRVIKKRLALPENANIVLSPRTIDNLYNLKTLLDVIPKVISKIPDTLFVFIGHHVNDTYLKELKEKANNLNISKNVLFIGKVNHDQVAQYHRASDVFVSVSPKDSGPIALQEAMACGNVPVISDLPCVRELITDGVNGYLLNPVDKGQIADAIIKLLLNKGLRKEMAERNWKIAQDKCDQEKEMKKMEDLYYKLINGG